MGEIEDGNIHIRFSELKTGFVVTEIRANQDNKNPGNPRITIFEKDGCGELPVTS